MKKFNGIKPVHLNSVCDYHILKNCANTNELYVIFEDKDCGYDGTQMAIVLCDAINIALAWVVNGETLTTL